MPFLFNAIPSQFARKNDWLMEKEIVLKVGEKALNLSKYLNHCEMDICISNCAPCVENLMAGGNDTYPTNVYFSMEHFPILK